MPLQSPNGTPMIPARVKRSGFLLSSALITVALIISSLHLRTTAIGVPATAPAANEANLSGTFTCAFGAGVEPSSHFSGLAFLFVDGSSNPGVLLGGLIGTWAKRILPDSLCSAPETQGVVPASTIMLARKLSASVFRIACICQIRNKQECNPLACVYPNFATGRSSQSCVCSSGS